MTGEAKEDFVTRASEMGLTYQPGKFPGRDGTVRFEARINSEAIGPSAPVIL
jgi:hypothetical protein